MRCGWRATGLLAIASAVAWASCATAAVTLNDTLDCGLPQGGFVRLTRAYEVSLSPFPIIHGRRVKEASTWTVEYAEFAHGARVALSGGVREAGADLQAYADACARVGLKHGVALAPRVFATSERTFRLPKEWFDSVPPLTSAKVSETLAVNKLQEGALGLTLVIPFQGALVSEQPLQPRGMAWWSAPLTAVYQSRSTDDGRTWSAPVVTSEALIFELGKPWREQCFLAVPVRYNGKAVQWPARCAADATPGKP